MMNKFFVRTGFSKLTDGELVMKANTIINSINNNDQFPTPRPAIPELIKQLEEFQDRVIIMPTGNRSDTILKNKSRAVLIASLKRLGSYVNDTAEDFVGLFTSGFEVSGYPLRNKFHTPIIPTNIRLGDSTHSGMIRVDFKHVEEARMYLYRHAAESEESLPWQEAFPTTRSRNNVIEGLSPGTKYYIQVKSINSAGASDWSDPVTLIAR